MRYHLSHCPDLSLATSRTTDRYGSKTSRIRISLCPAEGGRSSFMLAIRDAVIVSTNGRPSAGPLRSRTKMAWFTSWWLSGSDSYSSSRKASTSAVSRTSYSTRLPSVDHAGISLKNILNLSGGNIQPEVVVSPGCAAGGTGSRWG